MATNIGVKLGIDGESEYRKALKNIIEQTKTLDKQMGTLKSSFNDETDSMEANEKQTELLKQKAEKLNEEIEMMNTMVEKAAEIYGESSTECQKWEQALSDAQTELNNTNAAIAENESAAEDANTALGQLTTEISSQKDEMNDLRDAYINAVIEFGEGSEEAEELAGQIADLNTELSNNQTELDNATASYDNLISSLDNANESADGVTESMGNASDATSGIGSAAEGALGMFSPAMAGIVTAAASGDLLGAIGGVVSAISDIANGAIDIQTEFDEAVSVIAIGTDSTGIKLDELTIKAKQMWMAIKDEDFSLDDAANTVAALDTRLGEAAATSDTANYAVNQFATTTGVDTSTAVNGLVDVMKLWGLQTGDTGTDIQTLISIMDMLMSAQSMADVSVTTLINSLTSQSGSMEVLGMSMEDAIALMVSYRDGGGDVSDMTSTLSRAQEKLSDVTDDVPAAWQEVLDVLENSDSTYEAMNTEIGDLGITISDVFGDKKAAKIADVFTSSDVSVTKFSSSIESSNGTLERMYSQSRTTSDEVSQFGKTAKLVTEELIDDSDGITLAAGLGAGGIGTAINSVIAVLGLWGDASKTNSDTMTDNLSVVNDSANRNLSQLSGSFTTSMNGITSNVSSAQSSWQRIIGSTINGPTITAPTITYTKTSNGSMIPSATYHTYARAYGQALELNNPTIFGAMGSSLLKGGEKAGAEVVVGESHLLDMFEDSVRNAMGYVGNGGLYQIENLLREYLPAIGSQSIYLDTDELVGRTIVKINDALESLDIMTARGGY